MRTFLLVNLNNTSTKLALTDGEQILKKKILRTRELSLPRIRAAIAPWKVNAGIIGSVVPKKTTLFRGLRFSELLELTPRLNLGIGIDYPEPDHIGADRLANAVGVVARHGAPAIVVDFGTAVTFDIISHEQKYVGGVIGPGLGVMTEYLYQKTALLPRIDLEEPAEVIGKSTKQAMLAGAIFGYRGMVRQILTEIIAKLSGKARVVATGSYATLIAEKLPELQIVDPDLTLEGLRIIAKRNFRS